MSEFIYRKAEEKDIEEVGMLYEKNVDYLLENINYPGWMKGIYPCMNTAKEAYKDGSLYVLEKDGIIVSAVILKKEEPELYDSVEYMIEADYSEIIVVHTLAVLPCELRKGYGHEMVKHIIDFARSENCKAIRLDVYEKNIPAAKLYDKFGFKNLGKVDLGRRDIGLDWFYILELVL